STYQAGKVFTVGSHANALQLRFHHFDQAMGLARTPRGLAIGSRRQVWFLAGMPDLARRLQPAGQFDVCFLTHQSFFTGPIMVHDLGWGEGQLWAVNTLFSCLCVLDGEHNFVPRWKPSFVSELASQDRCHLNGLAMESGKPRYVTALGQTDTPAGWRPHKAEAGCLIEVASGRVLLDNLCMPHSPRCHEGRVWVLNSGKGELNRVDPASRTLETVASLPGYTRGLDFLGRYAFVGLSRIRETSVFGGLPIAERKDDLQCGVAVVDLTNGQTVAHLLFRSGVEEIFDVKVVPGFRDPILSGPLPDVDQTEPIWFAAPFSDGSR
ncbi:MAG: TIGR03032 family protein, partial [Gemmataceae bacterium]